MTLHALRTRVGDDAFFRILRTWYSRNAGGNVTTRQFAALAERISGRQLDDLFTAWLYTGEKPTTAATLKAPDPALAKRLVRGVSPR